MKTYIVANWKENPSSLAEAKKMFREIEKTLPVYKNCISVICPPAVYLTEANVLIKKAQQGVQDVFWHATGAYTGMMSAEMVKSAGANYAIIGHSERREFAGETNEIIQKKIKSALTAGLSVILCVGEKSRENDYIGIVRDQVKEGLRSISARLVANLIITYEPVWAISSANPKELDTPETTQEMIIYIRRLLVDMYGQKNATRIPLLYGGSVTSKNVRSFLTDAGTNGVLVGRASLNIKEFVKIASEANLTQ